MKILILGAGNAQIDAIEYCKKNGHKVYGCSYTDTDKGIKLLDEFEKINIIDIEKVADYVKQKEIDVVYSVGSDLAMPTVNKVSELLEMPHFVSAATAQICNMKNLMREELGQDFKGNVKFKVIENADEAKELDFYPMIMKPVDSQGQRGVCKVENYKEICQKFDKSKSYSKSKKVILEQFLDGKEISVNGYVVDGELKFALVSDRVSFSEFPGGIIKKHLIPTCFSAEVVKRVEELAQRVVRKLEILNGPVYFQIKVVNDEPYLIEVTPRLDGCHMWRLIKYCTGVDLLDISFNHLLKGEADLPAYELTDTEYELEFICQSPGSSFCSVEQDENAMFSRNYYFEGDTVRELNGYMEKCGYRIKKTAKV